MLNKNSMTSQLTDISDLTVPEIGDIQKAYISTNKVFNRCPELIKDLPLLRDLSGGVKIVLALENKQPTSSYKIRGVFAELMELPWEIGRKGVITASTGNHGKAVAYVAKMLGFPCEIVLPEGAPSAKADAIVSYGGIIIQHGSTYDDAYMYAKQLAKKRNITFIDVSSRLAVAGQGTLALEILELVPDADALLVPVGGGAFLAGMAIAAKEFAKERGREILVIGAEPEGAACCYESLKAGELVTIDCQQTVADSLRVQTPDAHLFPIICDLVDEIVKVPETSIKWGMGLLTGICRSPVEGAAAVGPMALLRNKGVLSGARGIEIDLRGKTVVTPLTGGNVDLSTIEDLL